MTAALADLAPLERTETLGARVRDRLRSAIMGGQFRPGDKLTLRALATSFGVSLTPAREALFNLAAEGILEAGPNGSIYIPRMTVEGIRELTKIRLALEGLAAMEATQRLSEADVAGIVSLNDRLIEADRAGDYKLLNSCNWQFHFRIYGAAGMPLLLKSIESCWLRSGSYLSIIYPEFGRSDAGIRNHQAIIRAIETRLPEALAAAIRQDIEFSSEAFIAAVREGK